MCQQCALIPRGRERRLASPLDARGPKLISNVINVCIILYYYLLFTRLLYTRVRAKENYNVFDTVFRRVARLIEPVCVAKRNVPVCSQRARQHI